MLELEIRRFALANAFSHDGKSQAGALVGKLIGSGLIDKDEIGGTMPLINKIVSEVNKLSLSQQEKELRKVFPDFFEKKEEIRVLPELPDISNKMVMRLAPYPSGALHIGNVKTYMLNALYAEKYRATLRLFMDDTIGSAEKNITEDSYKLIPEGFKWIGVKWNGPILYKSDRLKKYYKFAEDLIKKNLAYVCECPVEKLRDNRLRGVDCKCRSNSLKVNLQKWKNMLAKKYKEGSVALRLKTSMQHPNPAFRDRVLAKVVERPHPLTGKKYTVWPTLELSWAFDDHDLGSTHILRGKDLVIETDTCRFIWEKLGWKIPVMIHTGMIRLKGVKLSKSKSLKDVRSGAFTGWDDPRTLSLQSFRRRGIQPEAIREFIKEIGPNTADIEVPIDNLYNFNRKLIDGKAKRYFFVADPVEVQLKQGKRVVKLKVHPEKKLTRSIPVSEKVFIAGDDFKNLQGKHARLKGLCDVVLGKVCKLEADEEGQVIHWVSSPNCEVEVLMPDGSIVTGLAEPAVDKIKKGEILQFERFGFVRCDGRCKFVYAHR